MDPRASLRVVQGGLFNEFFCMFLAGFLGRVPPFHPHCLCTCTHTYYWYLVFLQPVL
jgi:hypothetical protein